MEWQTKDGSLEFRDLIRKWCFIPENHHLKWYNDHGCFDMSSCSVLFSSAFTGMVGREMKKKRCQQPDLLLLDSLHIPRVPLVIFLSWWYSRRVQTASFSFTRTGEYHSRVGRWSATAFALRASGCAAGGRSPYRNRYSSSFVCPILT